MDITKLLLPIILIQSVELFGQTGEGLFEGNCSLCHGHSSVMTGPPVTFISDVKDSDWFAEFLKNPYSFWKSKEDTYTDQMLEYYYPVYALHPPTKLEREELKLVWDFIKESESDMVKHELTDSLRQSWIK